MPLLRRKDLVCRQAVELVTDYLEGALSRRDRRRFEAHLKDCPNCAAYLEQIRLTIRLSGAVEPDQLSPAARADLTELYRRWRGGDPENGDPENGDPDDGRPDLL
jgi:anti-sigma factor RsiW